MQSIDRSTVVRGTYYSLHDAASRDEKNALGAPKICMRVHCMWEHPEHGWVLIMAKGTNECRPPKRGEWYISDGAHYAGHKATEDLTQDYYIAELVRVRQVIQYEEV